MLDIIKKAPRLTYAMSRRIVQQPSEALLLCRLAWWVTVTSVAARCFSLPRTLRIVSASTPTSKPNFSTEAQEQLARALDLVLSADVLMFRPVCWKRAAVLHRFLSLRGVATTICFGVKRGETTVTGHAWLEADGKPILEKERPDYVITYSFPSDEPFDNSAVVFSHE
jgi:hypothetical protein